MKFKQNVSSQDLPYVKEDKIQKDIFALEAKRSSCFQKKDDGYLESVKLIEKEICYLQREVDIRKRRKLAHFDFMQKKSKKRYNRARR